MKIRGMDFSMNLNWLPESPILTARIATENEVLPQCHCHICILTTHEDGSVTEWAAPCDFINRPRWEVLIKRTRPGIGAGYAFVSSTDAPRLIPEEVWDCLAGSEGVKE